MYLLAHLLIYYLQIVLMETHQLLLAAFTVIVTSVASLLHREGGAALVSSTEHW